MGADINIIRARFARTDGSLAALVDWAAKYAKADVQALLDEIDAIQPREKPTLGPWKADGGAHPSVWRRFDAAGVQRMCSGYLGWSVHTPEGECFADGPEICHAGRDPADRAARAIWDLDPGIPWRKLPDVCPGDEIGIHCRISHPSGMYECAFCGEVGA